MRAFLNCDVCVPLLCWPDIGESIRSRCHSLNQGTRGGRILTLHLNYVAGYTCPLLFLFEQTQQLTPLTTRGKPWRLRVWAGPKFVRPHRWGVSRGRTGRPGANPDNQGLVTWRLRRLGRSKVRLASLVKVLSDGKIFWDPKSQLSWNPPPPTTQSNTCL